MTLNKAFLHLSLYHDVSLPGAFLVLPLLYTSFINCRAVKHEVGAVNNVCSIRLLTDGRGELYYSVILFLFFFLLNMFSFFFDCFFCSTLNQKTLEDF